MMMLKRRRSSELHTSNVPGSQENRLVMRNIWWFEWIAVAWDKLPPSRHFSTPFVTDSALHGGPAQSQSPGHCRFGSHHDRSGNWISTERLGNRELLTTEWVIHSESLSGLVISEGCIPLSSRLWVPHFVFSLDSPSLSDESEKF